MCVGSGGVQVALEGPRIQSKHFSSKLWMRFYYCDRNAIVQACFSKYDQKFKNSSEKVMPAKFGKCSNNISAIGEEVFGEARNSSVKIEAYYFSKFQQKIYGAIHPLV